MLMGTSTPSYAANPRGKGNRQIGPVGAFRDFLGERGALGG